MKAHIRYAPSASNDLAEIKQYITEELANPQAGIDIMRKITKQVSSLQEFPDAGAPLSGLVGIKTNYRFLICENYLTFYKHEEEMVSIIRVLYRKRDYMHVLFEE